MTNSPMPVGGRMLGLSWDHYGRRTVASVVALVLLAALMLPLIAPPTELVPVIVRSLPGEVHQVRATVESAGGRIGHDLTIIDGFAAAIPAHRLPTIAAHQSVLAVYPDGRLSLLSKKDKTTSSEPDTAKELDPSEPGTMPNIVHKITHADVFWKAGHTGTGVDVAIIDSGISPVEGLTIDGKVINGADLSFESQNDALRHLDFYGHGTHLAGIIAGRDSDAPDRLGNLKPGEHFLGMAPDARLLSVKVADREGATDVSQVIAAIDWVVQHRNDNGMNIRVLNLAFGTDSTQDYRLDPLAYAVEVAWRHGIVVVVAAGNDGNDAPSLRNPATNPYVIAVGAAKTKGTASRSDDTIPDFSSCGTAARHVDLVAPGKSIQSLTSPGSEADLENPDGKVGERFMKGTGTSQAAAVVAGAAALILDQRPELTPDQVKALLTETATAIEDTSQLCQGSGLIDLERAFRADVRSAAQTWDPSTGLGSLEAARGSLHLELEGVELTGEQDIFGNGWDGASWSAAAMAGLSWSGGEWNGATWTGNSWSGSSWSGNSWSGASWSGASWSGASWSGASWSSVSWSSDGWAGGVWSGSSWSGGSWSGGSWSGGSWSTSGWGS